MENDEVRGPEVWAAAEPTGVRQVDDALSDLTQLDQLATSEHVAVYEAVHGQLHDALADLDGS